MHADGLDLAPFSGLRYVPERVGDLASVTSPPYDVVVRPDGLHHLEVADPHNIVRLILPQATEPAAGHRKAAETLHRWREKGVLAQDPRPALYVYEQSRPGVLQRGLIGALRLTPPEDGVVLPHEDVVPEIVADRTALMRETAANLEPLLLSYRGGADTETGAAAVIERTARRRPLLAITTEDGFRHRLWAVTEEAHIAEAVADLSRRRALISDGHHRWATCLRLSRETGGAPPWDRGLVLLVDSARYPLRVQAIHRLLPRLSPAVAVEQLAGAFRVRTLPDATTAQALAALEETAGTAFVLAGRGPFLLLDRPDGVLLERTVRTDRPEAWRRLDATVLHSVLLDAVWKVPDHPEDIGYLHDADAAVDQARRHGGTAVLMRAVTEDTVRELAEQGITMPRKSTSFGPKPATGLVLRTLDPG
ncbi:DUF1015 domain-containing protein [Streptomyces sodiiphilus]|uniref:DUF1015 domain-containing protein n=1 Tax=Streptomyces sodiiphilus TaxID=226217 RepID=A0ABN2NRR9_9ACTN